MAQLVVRNLEDDVKAKLQARAQRHKRSLEEEVREILRSATVADEAAGGGLGSAIAARFRGHGLKEGEEIPEWRGYPIEPLSFDS